MYVIIVGGGNTGSSLGKLLLESGHEVRLIEERTNLLEKLIGELPLEVIVGGDGSSPATLEQAGIQQAQVLAAVTGSDETNLVITSLARFEFNVPRIIARVNNPKNAWLFTEEMGVDVALNQADILAHLVAEEMSLGDMMTLLKLKRGEYSLVEEKVHPDRPPPTRPSGISICPLSARSWLLSGTTSCSFRTAAPCWNPPTKSWPWSMAASSPSSPACLRHPGRSNETNRVSQNCLTLLRSSFNECFLCDSASPWQKNLIAAQEELIVFPPQDGGSK